MRRGAVLLLAAALLTWAAPRAARAQATHADSAAILFDAAVRLDLEGKRVAADAVFDYIVRRFGDTPAAATARDRLAARPAEPERGGRLELLAWGTIYGAWLGIAVPIAAGAEGTVPYGIGLIVGPPLGYSVARSYLETARPTLGQARAMTFAFRWGSWQASGWLGALTADVSTEGAFTAMIAGGLGGMAAAASYTRHRNVSAGAVASASHGAYWGTYFGLMALGIFEIEGDNALRTVLLAGDFGMVAAMATAPKDITTGRVWMTTAAGVAGMAAGWGLDLILSREDISQQVVFAVPTITTAIGLVAGVALAKGEERDRRAVAPDGAAPSASALLQVDGHGTRLGLPAPMPALVPVGERAWRRLYRPAVAVPLFRMEF